MKNLLRMTSPGRGNEFAFDFYQQALRLARRVGSSNIYGFGSLWNGGESSDEENDLGLHGSGDSSDEGDDTNGNSDIERELNSCEEGKHKKQEIGTKKASSHKMSAKGVDLSLDSSIAHLTKTLSAPGQGYGCHVKNGMVHTVIMLHGRETNTSKRGRWSRAECCHMAARYLPVDSPKIIDQMNSRVYVGKFSSDGSLFVGGFQVCHYLSKHSCKETYFSP